MANDDEILSLLREMRDIQQQHLETYRAQSQRALSMNALVIKRQRIALVALFFFIAIACATAWYALRSSDSAQWKDIQDRAQQQLEQADQQWQRQMEARRKDAPIDPAK